MVGVESGESMLARVVIVNFYGNVLYDKFVQPKEQIVDYRTKVSGIRPSNLKSSIGLTDLVDIILIRYSLPLRNCTNGSGQLN